MPGLKVLELFAGYSSQAMALKRLGLEITHDIAEIDKYAIQANECIHGKTHNWGDITKIDEKELPEYDLITYSSPCQDFSTAGKQQGGEKGSGTRSSLLWECERIIKEVKPKYLLMENVKGLVSKKFKHNFDAWLNVLEDIGYTNYWQVLNAKDYGVPQNRERVFCVSIRKDVEQGYKFPEKIPLERKLKDILEPVVDESYYLRQEQVDRFLQQGNTNPSGRGMNGQVCTSDTSPTLTTNKGEGAKILCAASRGRNPENPSDRTVGSPTEQRLEYNKTGCTNTLTTVQKDNYVVEKYTKFINENGYVPEMFNPYNGSEIKDIAPTQTTNCGSTTSSATCLVFLGGIGEPNRIEGGEGLSREYKEGYRVYSPEGISTCIKATGGGLGGASGLIQIEGNLYPNSGNPQAGRVYDSAGLCPALDTMQGGNREPKVMENIRIRKLTPRECWRLMGVADSDFDKIKDISKSQLYKMAGNSIVVDVLEAIFRNLFINTTKKVSNNLFDI